MSKLARYWHTLRYLRPVQFYGRAWFRLNKPQLNLAEAPALRTMADVWVSPVRRRQSLFESFRFRFLNEDHTLAEIGWDSPHIEKLWRYNLHYFDDLNAEGSEFRSDWHTGLLARWVLENPPAKGTGWEPYPTSLRIVNWIKWALSGNTLPPDCLHSLAIQARWLSQRMEIHLLGNHLFANSKALVFAGLFFKGEEAERWLEKGLRYLAREIPEQILADGGQFERSTMYHALALEDMLDLCNLTKAFQTTVPTARVASWFEVVGQMRHWLAAMCHPDGEVSFFNDSAIGISPPPAELEAYARRLDFPALPKMPDGVTHLAGSGYIRIQRGQMVALLDVAPVGPDYLPGHAHADTLSFELSLFGQRVFVNSGTSCYGNSAERLRQRGTAAHNTVVVDGRNSSEVWGGFRVARRARPVDLTIDETDGTAIVSCAHDGFEKLKHTRKWKFGGNELVVEDSVSGRFSQAEARFHLHPSVKIDEKSLNGNGGAVVLQLADGQKIRFSVESGVLRMVAASWHPEFGRSDPNYCLSAHFHGSLLCTSIRWENGF